jgi:hypothetical protein
MRYVQLVQMDVVEPIRILMPRKSKRKPGMYRIARAFGDIVV